MDNKFELMKMLFEKHSQEFANRRAKIHSTTEKYIALIFVLFTAVNSQYIKIKCDIGILFSITVLILMIVILYRIYRDNKVSLEHAKVINKLNNEFGLFEKGHLLSTDSIYTNKWKNFGHEKTLKGIIHHFVIIIVITAALITSIYLSEWLYLQSLEENPKSCDIYNQRITSLLISR